MTREELLQSAKPILFNTEMVRAILDGRKTVTRRLVKPQPKMPLAFTFAGHRHGTWGYPSDDAWKYWGEKYRLPSGLSEEDKKRCWTPPYKADDILYVRETWAPVYPDIETNEVCGYLYKIDSLEDYDKRYPEGKEYQWSGTWKPSIHMPKEAARIFLKVKDVRVERLQEMRSEDALNEGIKVSRFDLPHTGVVSRFKNIWNSTIKKSDLGKYDWDANPWVWVIEFERVKMDDGE